MGIYRELRAAGITTRAAAGLTGLSRATVTRKPRPPLRVVPAVPVNRLSAAERANVVATLDSPRFVDQPPLQVYAQLLDEATYLCSVSSMYADPWRTAPGAGATPASPPPGQGPS
jgi:putative transposase